MEFDNNQSYTVVEYPHITTLEIMYMHTDYVEQLLNESKTRLARLMELEIKSDELQPVTEYFIRDPTRLNCSKMKWLIIKETIVYPEDFCLYFPLL